MVSYPFTFKLFENLLQLYWKVLDKNIILIISGRQKQNFEHLCQPISNF